MIVSITLVIIIIYIFRVVKNMRIEKEKEYIKKTKAKIEELLNSANIKIIKAGGFLSEAHNKKNSNNWTNAYSFLDKAEASIKEAKESIDCASNLNKKVKCEIITQKIDKFIKNATDGSMFIEKERTLVSAAKAAKDAADAAKAAKDAADAAEVEANEAVNPITTLITVSSDLMNQAKAALDIDQFITASNKASEAVRKITDAKIALDNIPIPSDVVKADALTTLKQKINANITAVKGDVTTMNTLITNTYNAAKKAATDGGCLGLYIDAGLYKPEVGESMCYGNQDTGKTKEEYKKSCIDNGGYFIENNTEINDKMACSFWKPPAITHQDTEARAKAEIKSWQERKIYGCQEKPFKVGWVNGGIDHGWRDNYRGWYTSYSGCPKSMFCRWGGSSGSGGEPSKDKLVTPDMTLDGIDSSARNYYNNRLYHKETDKRPSTWSCYYNENDYHFHYNTDNSFTSLGEQFFPDIDGTTCSDDVFKTPIYNGWCDGTSSGITNMTNEQLNSYRTKCETDLKGEFFITENKKRMACKIPGQPPAPAVNG